MTYLTDKATNKALVDMSWKKNKENLIKEVQELSVAKHTKKDLMKLNENSLKDIIEFKKNLKIKTTKKPIWESEVHCVPKALLVTNNSPDNINVEVTYDKNYNMWRVNVKKWKNKLKKLRN